MLRVCVSVALLVVLTRRMSSTRLRVGWRLVPTFAFLTARRVKKTELTPADFEAR